MLSLMETKEALENIIHDLQNNAFELSDHVLTRMSERRFSIQDIFALIKEKGLRRQFGMNNISLGILLEELLQMSCSPLHVFTRVTH